MDLGVLVPQIGHNSGPAALRDVAQAAEDLGFASLWTTDHVIMPATYSSSYPFAEDNKISVDGDQPYYELFTTLGYLSAVTERAKLGVAVCIVPYRNPVYLSKTVSSLDQLCSGRFIFGVGVGWLEEEFDAVGASYKTRGKLTDEALDFMRKSWAPEQPVSYDGELIKLEPSYFSPRPVNGPNVPYWVGGDGDVALRRTARFGDAWFPHLFGSSPEVLREKMERLADMTREAGRTPSKELALFLPLSIADTPTDSAAKPWETRRLDGTPDQIRDSLLEYKAAGVTHTLLMFGGRIERRIEWMKLLKDEVLTALAD